MRYDTASELMLTTALRQPMRRQRVLLDVYCGLCSLGTEDLNDMLPFEYDFKEYKWGVRDPSRMANWLTPALLTLAA